MKNVVFNIIDILLSLSLFDLIKNKYVNDITFNEAVKNKKTYDKIITINSIF